MQSKNICEKNILLDVSQVFFLQNTPSLSPFLLPYLLFGQSRHVTNKKEALHARQLFCLFSKLKKKKRRGSRVFFVVAWIYFRTCYGVCARARSTKGDGGACEERDELFFTSMKPTVVAGVRQLKSRKLSDTCENWRFLIIIWSLFLSIYWFCVEKIVKFRSIM